MQWETCLACEPPGLANGTRASVEVAKARCQNRSSKLCLSFGGNWPRSLLQMRLCKNHNFGTATSQHSKMVLNRDCAVRKSDVARL